MTIPKLIKGLLKILGGVVLILIMVILIMITVGEILKDETQLSPWGTGFFVVTTGSMTPAIPVGSLIFVTSVEADRIKENDIVTFFSTEWTTVVTHRVREIHLNDDSYVFITRGDANNVDDNPLDYERLIGRVLFIVPWSSAYTNSPASAIYVGIGIIAFGAVLCVTGIVGSFTKKKSKVKPGTASETDANSADVPGETNTTNTADEVVQKEETYEDRILSRQYETNNKKDASNSGKDWTSL